jgi:hypothetical protein
MLRRRAGDANASSWHWRHFVKWTSFSIAMRTNADREIGPSYSYPSSTNVRARSISRSSSGVTRYLKALGVVSSFPHVPDSTERPLRSTAARAATKAWVRITVSRHDALPALPFGAFQSFFCGPRMS